MKTRFSKRTQNFQRAAVVLSILPLALLASGGTFARSLKVPAPVLVLTAPFRHGEVVPKQFTADGADQSPPLSWQGVPEQAKSLAIICSDPDAPRGTWYHWLLYNLKPTTTSLPGNVPKTTVLTDGAMQGTNDFGKPGYNGPAPPHGQKHRYRFDVMALDIVLKIKPGATKEQVLNAIGNHVIRQGFTVGWYARP